jgi:predicted phosphodiesterase
MKTIIIGDVHGRDQWKQIVAQEKDADTVIFLGDYFDSFDISAVEQMHNFKEIVEFKETSKTEYMKFKITSIGKKFHSHNKVLSCESLKS